MTLRKDNFLSQPIASASINADRNGWIEIPRGFGFPLGGLGTGYSVFGRYGFLRKNFDSAPDVPRELYPHTARACRSYADNPAFPCDYAWTLECRKPGAAPDEFRRMLLAEELPEFLAAQKGNFYYELPRTKTRAKLPLGEVTYSLWDGVAMTMHAWAPLLPGDVEESSVPAQVYLLEMTNQSSEVRTITHRFVSRYSLFPAEEGVEMQISGLEFALKSIPGADGARSASSAIGVTLEAHGETAFYLENGTFASRELTAETVLQPGESKTERLVIGYYYPHFRTPSPAARQDYRRNYAKRFHSATEVALYAVAQGDEWRKRIENFHAAFDFPGAFTRLWFATLGSLMTGTMLADTGEYFEIETPHFWVNTMDVSAYSSWCVMVLYPELEKQDMEQFLRVIPEKGERKGFVWHSLWHDACHYAEEPTFVVRFLRDALYFGDKTWVATHFETLRRVMQRQYGECRKQDALIDSASGNQSYDAWKMPGINMYVNTPWIYALAAFAECARLLGKSDEIEPGVHAGALSRSAAQALDALLWNDATGSYNVFDPLNHETCNAPDTVFTDQFFGRWMVALWKDAPELFAPEKVQRALGTIYQNNLLTEPGRFRGWANGVRPHRVPELCSYHASCCWLGTQLDFAGMLALNGREAEALDVYSAVEGSLNGMQLAGGEWNLAATEIPGRAAVLTLEPGKDSNMFPAYPRYKSCWESVVRLAGLTLNWETLEFAPGKLLDFELKTWHIAQEVVTLRVEKSWTRIYVDGKLQSSERCEIRRGAGVAHTIEFLQA